MVSISNHIKSTEVSALLTLVSLLLINFVIGATVVPENECEGLDGSAPGILGGACPSPNSGDPAPELDEAFQTILRAPESSASKLKLGLAETTETFIPADLHTDLFVLLVFDLYCHACQQSAKNMTLLYEQIQNDPRLRKAAVIGIGRGDTPFEVETFMQKLKLDFPAVSDRDKSFTDALGVDRTPSGFLICRKTGEYRILSSFTGYLSRNKAEKFLSPMHISKNDVE